MNVGTSRLFQCQDEGWGDKGTALGVQRLGKLKRLALK